MGWVVGTTKRLDLSLQGLASSTVEAEYDVAGITAQDEVKRAVRWSEVSRCANGTFHWLSRTTVRTAVTAR